MSITDLWLEVPVDDPLEVHEVDGGHELGHDARGLRLVEAPLPPDPPQQLAALQVLHHNVGVRRVLNAE